MSSSGKSIQQPTGYKAFIPHPLPPKLTLDGATTALCTSAERALAELNGLAQVLPSASHLIAMYVRKEALLSSQIEGTQASLEDLFDYASDLPLSNLSDVEEVVRYVKALNHGLTRLEEFPMSIRLIKEIHQILLDGGCDGHKTPGEFRRSQNWIGPPGSTLATATFVPPPPYEAKEAIGELELFLQSKWDLPLLVVCALVHYQFETIHPFLDGNGRLGRLLIPFLLCWKGALSKPLLYLSYYFKVHRQEYYDRLTWVRNRGNFEQWIDFFLEGVKWTCASALESGHQILELQALHRAQLVEQAASAKAFALLEWLYEKPLFALKEAGQALNISYQASKTLVGQFERLGFVKETTGQKRNKRYAYSQYLDILAKGTHPIF